MREVKTVPEYIALAVYYVNRQRAGIIPRFGKEECELSLINNACSVKGVVPTQEIYDQVFETIKTGYDYVH